MYGDSNDQLNSVNQKHYRFKRFLVHDDDDSGDGDNSGDDGDERHT